MITKKECMKILDYILENNLDLIDGINISNDFLLQIRNYVKGKRKDDKFILDLHKQIIINHFLEKGYSFNSDTPLIIIKNEKCLKKAINNDINAINYLYDNSINIDSYIDLIIKNNYIISINSPKILKKNINIIINSINNDYTSVDNALFELLNDNEKALLVQELLKTDYTLNSHSPEFLRKNLSIILHSIKKDVNTYKYSYINFCKCYDIFKTLLDNNYKFNNNEDYDYLQLLPLSFIKTKENLYRIFEILDLYIYNDNNYKNNFSKLYFNLLTNFPTIKSYDNMINYLCDISWIEYRNNNLDILSNVYSKIISIIKKNNSYENFNREFIQLGNQMANIIGNKYNLLIESIKKYYQVYYSNNQDKEKLESYALTISKISALFISMKKEQYKNDIKELFYDHLKNYYIPKLENKIVKKRIQHSIKKDIFIKKYNTKDKDVIQFITDLSKKYIDLYGDWIKKAINRFITNNITNLRYIIKSPNNYSNYLRYIEAIKLVNRLNKGYLEYDDQELYNYKDIIKLDNSSLKYIYTGKMDFDINKCNCYYNQEIILQKMIKEVMLYINNIELNNDINNNTLVNIKKDIIGDLPFTDDYYQFNPQILDNYRLGSFVESCISKSRPLCEVDNFDYDTIYEILSKNNLIWLWTLKNNIDINRQLFNQNINIHQLVELFNNIDKIKSLSNNLKIDYSNYGNLSLLYDLSKYSDNYITNLIRPDIIKTLCSKTEYTAGYSKKEILKVSSDLICEMAKRQVSTVPYLNGYTNGYYYTMYDNLEDDVLTTGPDVDSCLKVCGNDNDFLHYCMLDKNGFIIKIINQNNHFIGRAAGFRNGNIIYINQFRTIYDVGGTGYNSNFKSEKDEIIEVLIKACQDIVNISKNSKESTKIDYIFITQSYAFEKYKVDKKLSHKVSSLIGIFPVDIYSSDWNYFIKNTHHLYDSSDENCFKTDYDDYDLICLASSKDPSNIINNNDIHIGDVEPTYKRPRNKIIVTYNISNEIIRKINKIRTIYTYYHKDIKYTDVIINNNDLVIIGDNWYLIYNDNIIDYCIQDFDEVAQYEFNEISKLLLEYKDENQLKEILSSNKLLVKHI